MAGKSNKTARMPAMKFPKLRKQMQTAKVAAAKKKLQGRKKFS
jgi:hypothetical protein